MTHKKQFFLDYNQLILCNIILFFKKKCENTHEVDNIGDIYKKKKNIQER